VQKSKIFPFAGGFLNLTASSGNAALLSATPEKPWAKNKILLKAARFSSVKTLKNV
jgi:hypothetical protein